MNVTIKQTHRPAQGLKILTWTQVEELDAKAASLSAYAQATGQPVMMTIFFNPNGKPMSIGEPMAVSKFKATRD